MFSMLAQFFWADEIEKRGSDEDIRRLNGGSGANWKDYANRDSV